MARNGVNSRQQSPTDASSFQSDVRKTFHGRAVAAVSAGSGAGPITVEIAGDGLFACQVQIDAVSSSP
uniref:hypothetical protein n=1 Tax=Altererythrobacter segetis TaxID=1104773 RepID=UPI00140B05CC